MTPPEHHVTLPTEGRGDSPPTHAETDDANQAEPVTGIEEIDHAKAELDTSGQYDILVGLEVRASSAPYVRLVPRPEAPPSSTRGKRTGGRRRR